MDSMVIERAREAPRTPTEMVSTGTTEAKQAEPTIITAYEKVQLSMADVDRDLRPVIRAWNRLSFTRTLYCCAGHPPAETSPGRISEPYILFLIHRQSYYMPAFLDAMYRFCRRASNVSFDYFCLKYGVRCDWPGLRPRSDLAFRLGSDSRTWLGPRLSIDDHAILRDRVWPALLMTLEEFKGK